MIIKCPECGQDVSDRAAFCPHCGCPPGSTAPVAPAAAAARAPRRKHRKLPNGFGSITRIGGGENRTNRYAVFPPVKEFTEDGRPVKGKAIAYVDSWYAGFGVLSAYHAGKYEPGMELAFDTSQITDPLVRDISAAFCLGRGRVGRASNPTLAEVYASYMEWEFGKLPESRRDDSEADRKKRIVMASRRTAYRFCLGLADRPFKSLRYPDLQGAVDSCDRKHATKELVVQLFRCLYRYADAMGIQREDESRHVRVRTQDDDEPGVPFTMDELRRVWLGRDDPALEMVFIMCLSGFRVSAYRGVETSLEGRYFRGGVKTANGKGRVVPIHPAILPLVRRRLERDGGLMRESTASFRGKMYAALGRAGIERHTPHDCRDTFATLCDRFGVDRLYAKRLMGHSLGGDITQEKYVHPELDALRREIEKIDLSGVCAPAESETAGNASRGESETAGNEVETALEGKSETVGNASAS